MKQCRTCKEEKNTSDYYKCSKTKGGFKNTCKECIRLYNKSSKNKVNVLGKACSKCGKIKTASQFYKARRSTDGLRSSCKDCTTKYTRKYYIDNKERILSSNKVFRDTNKHLYLSKSKSRRDVLNKEINTIYNDRIKEIYYIRDAISEESGIEYQIDHIIPLKHRNVCGLNVPWNLQILTEDENRSKKNKFDGTYNNESWR